VDAAGILLVDLENLADAVEALAPEIRGREGMKVVA
jgi:hypothetical protein